MPSQSRRRRVSRHRRSCDFMCVLFLYLVAFIPWPGSGNIVASVSCVAWVHFTVRATSEAILDHGAPGAQGMGPPGAVTPFPHVSTVPGSVGLSGGAAAGTSRIGPRCTGRGDGTVLGIGAGSDLLVAFL